MLIATFIGLMFVFACCLYSFVQVGLCFRAWRRVAEKMELDAPWEDK